MESDSDGWRLAAATDHFEIAVLVELAQLVRRIAVPRRLGVVDVDDGPH